MTLSTFVTTVILVKWYCVLMLLGSGVLWWITFRNAYQATKKINLWAYFGFILVGLSLSVYFINGWRPHSFFEP